MDKATKVAVEKYPHGTFDGELGDSLRATCAVGYMQAEKDLALSWKDIAHLNAMVGMLTKQEFKGNVFEEVLRRFNETRK